MKKIAIGCDHGGYELKEFLREKLETRGYEVRDFGCHSVDSVDYPDIAHALTEELACMEDALGILICGSGNGINMSANANPDIISALCWQPEIASLARQHNDANVMALPGRFIDEETAWQCVENFITEEFEGGRHERRVNKIKKYQ